MKRYKRHLLQNVHQIFRIAPETFLEFWREKDSWVEKDKLYFLPGFDIVIHMKRIVSKDKRKRKKNTAPMDAALKYLGARARTVREVERHLDDCQYGEVEIMETVQRLEELNLLNDQAFAEEFIRTRLATKPMSRAHLREQLLSHEIPKEILETVLAGVDDEMEQHSAYLVAEKYLRQFAGLEDGVRRDRALKRVLARGYSFDRARAAVEAAWEDRELESAECRQNDGDVDEQPDMDVSMVFDVGPEDVAMDTATAQLEEWEL